MSKLVYLFKLYWKKFKQNQLSLRNLNGLLYFNVIFLNCQTILKQNFATKCSSACQHLEHVFFTYVYVCGTYM